MIVPFRVTPEDLGRFLTAAGSTDHRAGFLDAWQRYGILWTDLEPRAFRRRVAQTAGAGDLPELIQRVVDDPVGNRDYPIAHISAPILVEAPELNLEAWSTVGPLAPRSTGLVTTRARLMAQIRLAGVTAKDVLVIDRYVGDGDDERNIPGFQELNRQLELEARGAGFVVYTARKKRLQHAHLMRDACPTVAIHTRSLHSFMEGGVHSRLILFWCVPVTETNRWAAPCWGVWLDGGLADLVGSGDGAILAGLLTRDDVKSAAESARRLFADSPPP